MARYLEVAAEACKVAEELVAMVPDDMKARAAEVAARLVNYGIRCAPRAVHSTVRLNAVKRAVQGLPVRVTMEERKDERTGRSYKVLVTQQVKYESDNMAVLSDKMVETGAEKDE